MNGKTVNQRLTEEEAALYNEWISSDRRVRPLLSQMQEVAAEGAGGHTRRGRPAAGLKFKGN